MLLQSCSVLDNYRVTNYTTVKILGDITYICFKSIEKHLKKSFVEEYGGGGDNKDQIIT
jgi:hypothetical protein